MTQRDQNGHSRVIAYSSHTLCPNEKSMHNYSSTKLELVALKWTVSERLHEYLLGCRFTVLTDNNTLAHVKESKRGAAQILWLSEFVLFDFDTKY